MERMNVIKVVVTPQKPIEVKTQVKTTQVQIGTDAALGAVTQGVIDLHKKVDDLANKQVEVDLTPVAKEQTLLDKAEEIKQAVEKGGGSIILQTQEENARFKEYMQTKINNILNNEL